LDTSPESMGAAVDAKRGAQVQAILVSVFQTLKQRGYQGTDRVIKALRPYFTKKTPYPAKNATNG